MDIRHFFQDLLLVLFFICFQPGFSFIEDDYEEAASFGRCPWIRNKLKNGRVRYRYKGRVAKFLCDSGYDLAGKRSSTCVRGQWSNPVPVCVARGCSRVPMISNGHVTEMYRGALLAYDCNPGYTLDGIASIHCDGRRWSSSPPICVVATENPEMSCDFENPDLCGWSHDPNHDFDWKRNQFTTPSGHAGTGPSYDHTFGENKGGYYLYIEASSPRKINDTARLFSPVYTASSSGGCFHFWYHMFGATTGGLRVYIKPESHVFDELLPNWEKYGDQGNEWNRGSLPIPRLHENFQVLIEGIRGESYVGDSAIDDVSLTTDDCSNTDNITEMTAHTNADSCRGRCREEGDDSNSFCGCNDNCYSEHNCCSDYVTYCFEGNETTVHNTDETSGTFTSKTSPITSTAAITIPQTSEQYSSSISTTSTSDLSTPTTEANTLPATFETSTGTVSTSSRGVPELPVSSVTYPRSTTFLSTAPSTSTTNFLTTRITSSETVAESSTSTISPKPDTSSSTSTGTTKSAPTSLETTTSSTAGTTLSSTTFSSTVSSKVSSTASSTITSTSNTKLSVQTTLTTVSPLTTLPASMESTTVPTYFSTTTSTRWSPTTAFISSSTLTTVTSSSLPNSTVAFLSTTSSSAMPSTSVTTEPSTRKTYNLRPRTIRTTTPVSTRISTEMSTPRVTATEISKTPTSTSSTSLKDDIATSPESKSKYRTHFTYRWHDDYSETPTYGTTVIMPQRLSTFYTTKVDKISATSRSYTRQTTERYTPKIFRYTSTTSPYAATSDSYEMGTSKAETTSSSSSTPVVISLLAIIVCIVAGVVYYLRKQKGKRQSKLSDDSEMRFLQENEHIEYSDASALDRILIK